MRILISLIAGLVFGMGLILSGMANPAKVQNFLDIFGNWDPSLAFVMAGAIAVAMPAFNFAKTRSTPIYGTSFSLPTKQDIDPQLIIGASIFGIGWGLVGLCPGPAIVALSSSLSGIFVFFTFMIIGLIFVKTYRSQRA